MPQIRICQNCKKILQPNEAHECTMNNMVTEFVRCRKCGQKYKPERGHICPTIIQERNKEQRLK